MNLLSFVHGINDHIIVIIHVTSIVLIFHGYFFQSEKYYDLKDNIA